MLGVKRSESGVSRLDVGGSERTIVLRKAKRQNRVHAQRQLSLHSPSLPLTPLHSIYMWNMNK